MTIFPPPDPIPVPAPIWLLKALHIGTVAVHFIAVQLLLGGLLLALLLVAAAKIRRYPQASRKLTVAYGIARRLPVVMTVLINFGVPPLLFAQVLYGRALYTSSVLIGMYWIAVIPLLAVSYWLLYRFSEGLQRGKALWWLGAIAWIAVITIARIYVSNMTLMLRPEVWPEMYDRSRLGVYLPSGDPTINPRWVFMLVGGLFVAALWLIWLSGQRGFLDGTRLWMMKTGGALGLIFGIAELGVGLWAYWSQPAQVRTVVSQSGLYVASIVVWFLSLAALVCVAGWCMVRRPLSLLPGYTVVSVLFVMMLATVIIRDGIRDVTLRLKGFDVWAREVLVNWSSIALFFGAFLLALVLVGWMVFILRRAKPVNEELRL